MNIDDVVNQKLDKAAYAEMAPAKGDEMNFEELESECRAYQHDNPQEYGSWIWQVTDGALNALARISERDELIMAAERMIGQAIIENVPMGAWERWSELYAQWQQQRR